MAWFDDDRLKDIYQRGRAAGIASEDAFIIRRKLVILMATRNSRSHWLVGTTFRRSEGRRSVQVAPEWAISFEWIEDVGPFTMRLESMTGIQ